MPSTVPTEFFDGLQRLSSLRNRGSIVAMPLESYTLMALDLTYRYHKSIHFRGQYNYKEMCSSIGNARALRALRTMTVVLLAYSPTVYQ